MNLGNPITGNPIPTRQNLPLEAQRQGAIQEQLCRLDEITSLLRECATELSDRVAAILRPAEKEAQQQQPIPRSSEVPLAMRLEEKNMELHDIMAKIRSIIDRVEL